MATKPTGMTPQQENALRLRLSIILSSVGGTARLFTMNDPALGLTIMYMLNNMTGKYWDEFKTVYETLKGGGVMASDLLKALHEFTPKA